MGEPTAPMGDTSDFSGGQQPMLHGQPPMDGDMMGQGAPDQMGGGMDSPMPPMGDEGQGMTSKIDDIYNQLSDDDKKATEKYAQSLLDRSEENNPDMGGEPAPGGEQMPAGAPPIQEVYTMYEGRLIPGRIGCRRKSSKKNR